MENCAATIDEGLDFRTFEINLPIEGYEQLNGFDLGMDGGKQTAVVNQFIREVFDGVAQDFEGASGGGINVAPAAGTERQNLRSRGGRGNRKSRSG